MSSWDQITKHYQTIAIRPNWAPIGQGMLDLIPRLKEHPELGQLQASVGHWTLRLGLPGYKRIIHVDWQSPNSYVVYLDHCKDNFYGEKVSVPSDAVIATLETYVQRLREEAMVT